jgi:hypothetical protein
MNSLLKFLISRLFSVLLIISIFFYVVSIFSGGNNLIHASSVITTSSTNLTSITSCGELQYGIDHGTSSNGEIHYVEAISDSGGFIGITISPQGVLGNLINCTQPNLNSNFYNLPAGTVIVYTEPSGLVSSCIGHIGCHYYQVYNPILPTSSSGSGKHRVTSLPTGSISDPLGGTVGTSNIISTLLGIVLPILYGLIGVIVLGLISYAGFLFMTSSGDSNKVEKAKSVLTGAIIGASIIILAYIISLVLIHTL